MMGGRDYYASVVAGDGKLYAVSRNKGTLVLSADPKLEVLATNTMDDTSVFNAGPVSMFQQPYAGNYVSPSIYAATSRKASAGSLDSAATAPAWSSW